MTEPEAMEPAIVEDLTDGKPKRGDTIEHVVRIETRVFAATALHDEDAEKAFREHHAPRQLKDVELVDKRHVVGKHIDYVFTGVLK